MILLIDNYDSFVYNLARYVRELGEQPVVRRHDATTLEEIGALRPSHIIISPGPCTPGEAGISTDVVRRFGPSTPILGVCLGHQCIGAAYGAGIVRAGRPMHGKASRIRHDGNGVFAGLPNPFPAARYHSLVISRSGLPAELRVTASAEDGEIMAVEHARHPVIGLQFHPESVLTEYGYVLLDRFLHGAATRLEDLPDRADGVGSASAALPGPAAPAVVPPPAVPANIFGRASALAARIKKHPNYTEAMGQDLGIIGAEQVVDYHSLKPILDLTLQAGRPNIGWTKQGTDGLELQVDRGDTKGFVFLAFDTVPDYLDTAPLPASGASAVWKYKGIYRVSDEQTGQWSDVSSISVMG